MARMDEPQDKEEGAGQAAATPSVVLEERKPRGVVLDDLLLDELPLIRLLRVVSTHVDGCKRGRDTAEDFGITLMVHIINFDGIHCN